MKFYKKGSENVIWILVTIPLVLMVAYLLLYQNGRLINTSQSLLLCKSNGGILIEEECDLSVTNKFIPGDTEEGNCCTKKSRVSDKRFEEWRNTTTEIVDENDPNVVPVGPDNQITTEVGNIPGGDARIAFGGKVYDPNKDPFKVLAGQDFSITATHNIDAGEYCHLYIVEAQRSGSGWRAKKSDTGQIIPVGGLSKKERDCDPKADGALVVLKIESAIATPGMYKADYIIRESETGERITSRTLIFEVLPRDDLVVTADNPPTISVTHAVDSLDQKLYCWISVNVVPDDDSLPPTSIQVGQTSSTGSCTQASYAEYKPNGEQAIMGKLCLKVRQEYAVSQNEKKNVTPSLPIIEYPKEECDFYEIVSHSERTSSACSINDCKEFNKNQCSDVSARASGCKFSPDCYYRTFRCRDCESKITSCGDYKNKASCESNQCLNDRRCQWETELLGFITACVPYVEEQSG